MSFGVLQGYLLTHCKNRDEVIEYLLNLDLTSNEKNNLYKYWKKTKVFQKVEIEHREYLNIIKLNKLKAR